MKALPIELRERIVQAVSEGESKEEVAIRFKVSYASVKRYVKQYQEKGHLIAGQSTGRPKKVQDEHLAMLQGQVKEKPDWSIKDYRDWFVEKTGIKIGKSTIQRKLAVLRLTRKKRPINLKNVTNKQDGNGLVKP